MMNELFKVGWLLVLLFFVSAAQKACHAGKYGFEKSEWQKEQSK